MTRPAPPFSELSYRAQIEHLRRVAKAALPAYGLGGAKLDFLNHGENTTFRATARRGSRYLVRIHRPHYHSAAALEEELNWLERLELSTDLLAPRLLRTREGERYVRIPDSGGDEARQVDVFRWIEGRFLGRSLRPAHYRDIGVLTARLQTSARGLKTIHRRYWDAEGLVGARPKFSCIDELPDCTRRERETLRRAREFLLTRIRRYAARAPGKFGLIHADLHFGNLLFRPDGIAPIDFDDCGTGFYVYDLAVTRFSSQPLFQKFRARERRAYLDALCEGYASQLPFDEADRRMIPIFFYARAIMMMGWLNSRRDNPSLRDRLRPALNRYLPDLRRIEDAIAESIF